MRKGITGILTVALLCTVGTMTVSAGVHGKQCERFLDANQNSICDYKEDGVLCPDCHAGGKEECEICEHKYIDENNDNICDNCVEENCQERREKQRETSRQTKSEKTTKGGHHGQGRGHHGCRR